MRQYRLRSIMALIAVIALSLWVGMQIERARSGSRSYKLSYTVMRPVSQSSQTGKTYTVMRPVKVTRGRTRP
jgi:YTV